MPFPTKVDPFLTSTVSGFIAPGVPSRFPTSTPPSPIAAVLRARINGLVGSPVFEYGVVLRVVGMEKSNFVGKERVVMMIGSTVDVSRIRVNGGSSTPPIVKKLWPHALLRRHEANELDRGSRSWASMLGRVRVRSVKIRVQYCMVMCKYWGAGDGLGIVSWRISAE
jgi:hypothetical protein